MAKALTNVKIRRFALTRKGANRVPKSIYKSDGMGDVFAGLTEDEIKILKNKKPANLAKADFLLEVARVAEQLRKGDLLPDDAADFLDEVVIKGEKDIPVEKKPDPDDGPTDFEKMRDIMNGDDAEEETTPPDELRELAGL